MIIDTEFPYFVVLLKGSNLNPTVNRTSIYNTFIIILLVLLTKISLFYQ